MSGFINLRFPICITAAAGQKHTSVMETNVIDNGKLIVRYGLFKCPEIVIGRGHHVRRQITAKDNVKLLIRG